MGKKFFSKDVSEFQERFQNFHTFYQYQQKQFREKADKEIEKKSIIMSSVYNGKADELANVIHHIEILIVDFENLITIGLIKKEV